jgi:hypothetical protein
MDRRFSGTPIVEEAVKPQSKEIVLSQKFFEDMSDGHRLIVHGDNEPPREIRVTFYKVLDAQDCQMITEGITTITGLPVRLLWCRGGR